MAHRMETKKKPRSKSSEKAKKGLRDYARYSSLGFRLIAIVLVGFFGGMKLDQVVGLDKPVFTIVLAAAGLFLSLYLVIKDLMK
jgi:F0F1-type ATP synthase assembly protein I